MGLYTRLTGSAICKGALKCSLVQGICEQLSLDSMGCKHQEPT